MSAPSASVRARSVQARIAAVLLASFASVRATAADPFALRADVYASTAAPAGLVSVSADGELGHGLSAEAVVWTGQTGTTSGTLSGDRAYADVLVMAIHARVWKNRAYATLGRFVAQVGALRPVQVDGGDARIAGPYRLTFELFGGVPVEPDLTTSRAWDWIAGGRASRRVGDWGSVGVAYMQQRSDGELDLHEVGVDAGAAFGKHDDIAAKFAYDLANPGVAEATLTASDKHGALRTEVYATYIAASHILPAISLFTVLGDTPSVRAGVTATWRAAPRLDVYGDVAVRRADGDPIDGPVTGVASSTYSPTAPDYGEAIAPVATLRGTLRLDDKGASALAGEVRRDGTGDAGWTGLRGTARIALPYALAASTEIELVIPDHDTGLGRMWPWGLVSVSRSWCGWHAALAIEAQASPEDRSRVDVLAQLGKAWGFK